MMSKENILITGGGGREHALGWKIRQSPGAGNIFFTPGHAGTELIGPTIEVDLSDRSSFLKTLKANNIHRLVIGPEAHLVLGLANIAQEEGLLVTGATREAAVLETDKAKAVEFMERHGIPHPNTFIPDDYRAAMNMATSSNPNELVIKATGPARGKGVILPENREEATQFVRDVYINKKFGENQQVIFQERLFGKEISFIVFSDGVHAIPLLPAKDYKRIGENDTGKNTGGMGSFVPRVMSQKLYSEAMEKIISPTIKGMREEGTPFKGILYAGLMATGDGLKVIEYNARFGDPETQPLMMMLDSDLLSIFRSMDDETLSQELVRFKEGSAVCAVLAAPGYPDRPIFGQTISGLDQITNPNVQVFHSGTQNKNGLVLVSGGRAMGVTAYADNLEKARTLVYENAEKIKFKGKQIRRDIAA